MKLLLLICCTALAACGSISETPRNDAAATDADAIMIHPDTSAGIPDSTATPDNEYTDDTPSLSDNEESDEVVIPVDGASSLPDEEQSDKQHMPDETAVTDNDTDAAQDTFAKARELCVAITNGYRQQLSIAPLSRATDKESCNDTEAASDSVSGKPHGAFGTCSESAQNECPGWPSNPETSITQCLKMMFDEGPGSDYAKHGHYINMTNTKYTKVSCGFAISQNGSLWIVQNFW